jgi:hypothetical protein
MDRFIEQYAEQVTGILHGWDRLLFRGTLRSIAHQEGMAKFLCYHQVKLKHFKPWAERLSQRIKDQAKSIADEAGRPHEYVKSSKASKEKIARRIMERDGIERGLICVLTCVEPCQSFKVRRDPERKKLVLVPWPRKCLHVYLYFVDRELGFMHIRLQTWLPFPMQVCINGREYLARRMDRAGIGYVREGNCFTQIDDVERAQSMLDDLTTRQWPRILNALAWRVNPWLDPRSGLDLHGYYWSLRESEYATDIMFRDAAALQRIYPALSRHAILHFRCEDVLRFLGRRTNSRFDGEVTSHFGWRVEGFRIRHWVEENSIKMYDKAGSVLRIETTLNNPRRFRVWREVTRKGERTMGWVPMRKGVADIDRRVDLCRAANGRYLEALAVVGISQPTQKVLDPVSRPVRRRGRSYRPLRPITKQETAVFRAILGGQFAVQGFRNRDLREYLYGSPPRDPQQRRRLTARITRMLRLLRAHGLIRKVSTTRYYRVTEKGHQIMTVALRLRDTDTAALAA